MRNDLILRDNEKGRLGALPAAGHSFTKFIFVGHVCKIQTMELKKPKFFPASKALKVKNQLTTKMFQTYLTGADLTQGRG